MFIDARTLESAVEPALVPPPKLPIVLTGTIVPNAVLTAHADAEQRRTEYLASIHHYRRFGPVFFLENSSHDLAHDPEFHDLDNLTVIKFAPSAETARGKGYQEFEMLDRFVAAAPVDAFLKITGRYIIKNIDAVYSECTRSACDLLIEQKRRSPVALTDVFYARASFYRRVLAGLYRQSNDSEGVFIEHVVRSRLDETGDGRLFRTIPIKTGRQASDGTTLPHGPVFHAKRALRTLAYTIDSRHRLI